jgi:hypothetical protein
MLWSENAEHSLNLNLLEEFEIERFNGMHIE